MKQPKTQRFQDRRTTQKLGCTKCNAEIEEKVGENKEGSLHLGCGGEFQ